MGMLDKVNPDVLYVCSVVEYISRQKKIPVTSVVQNLGKDTIDHAYEYADVYHCMSLQQSADEIVEYSGIGKFGSDTVREVEPKNGWRTPTISEIGKVYGRLVTDVADGRPLQDVLYEVLTSWIIKYICNFDSAMYFTDRTHLEWFYRNECWDDD